MALPVTLAKDFQRRTLGPRQRPMVRALGEALFSPDGEASPERLESFVDEVDGFISPASKTLRFGLLAMLFVLKWSPLAFGRVRTFDELTVDERVHHLERLDRSRVRQLPLIVVAFKTVMTMLYYEEESELRDLGYPGPERKRYLKLASPVAQSTPPPASSAMSPASSPPSAPAPRELT